MNNSLLNIEIQEFINEKLNSDVNKLILKGTSFEDVKTSEIIEQIEAKKKCKPKLPTWFKTENIYYPNKLNIEQTSSEITAQYKSQLISGKSIIDLTGGFGVDCFYFSKRFKSVTHCEINEQLSEIVKHNYNILEVPNIVTICKDGVQYLKAKKDNYDWIYVDPSRRHESKGKVFFLKDCLPNIPQDIDSLFEFSNNVMIKTSPLLDISVGLNELKFVKEIHVVAVNNDVKELLWILENGFIDLVEIKTINHTNTVTEKFDFILKDEINAKVEFSKPLSYLYEPNSAIMKSGAFKTISDTLKLYKLEVNSHLYTFSRLINFPGRVFNIEKVLPYNKQLLNKESFNKANITIRNFPESVQQIRKKHKISEGGNLYLFFTINMHNEKIVIICSKIN